MTDTKLTALEAITQASGDELLYVVDDPSGTPVSKKVTLDNLLNLLSGQLILMDEVFS